MARLHYNLPVLVEEMFPEVARLDAPEAALITAVGSLARVSHHVGPQCRGLSEGCPTLRAGEPRALMDSHVGRQVGLGGRPVVTAGAVKVLLLAVNGFLVSHEVTGAVVVLLTQLTPIFFTIVFGGDVNF